MRILIQLICLLFFTGTMVAQNPRLALYESSPMMVNPAWTGKFNGKIQVGAHGSMMSVDSAKMLHTNFSVEYRSKYDREDRRNLKYWAAGLNVYRYGHSTSPLSAMFITGSAAYHTYIDRRRRHNFSAGFQATMASGKLNRQPEKDYIYDPEISGGGFTYRAGDSDTPSVSHSYLDFNIGVNYAYRTTSFTFESGLAMYHLFYPPNDIFQLDTDIPRLRHRGVFTMQFGFDLDEINTLQFKSMYWADGLFWLSRSFNDRGTDEYKVASWFGVELIKAPVEEKVFRVNYGLHSRSFRTVMPVVSAFYKDQFNLRATYEYPMNSKNFAAYRAKRMELSLFIYLNPVGKVKPYTED